MEARVADIATEIEINDNLERGVPPQGIVATKDPCIDCSPGRCLVILGRGGDLAEIGQREGVFVDDLLTLAGRT